MEKKQFSRAVRIVCGVVPTACILPGFLFLSARGSGIGTLEDIPGRRTWPGEKRPGCAGGNERKKRWEVAPMRAVIQRVSGAGVTVNGGAPRTIGRGLVILLGVKDTDTLAVCPKLAQKCAGLRIFEDADGKLNISAEELGLEALVVSNFTLYGDTKKGKRPSFIAAAKPPLAVDAYETFVAELRKTGLSGVQTGEFGADMQVSLTNDGPITIVIDTDEWKK